MQWRLNETIFSREATRHNKYTCALHTQPLATDYHFCTLSVKEGFENAPAISHHMWSTHQLGIASRRKIISIKRHQLNFTFLNHWVINNAVLWVFIYYHFTYAGNWELVKSIVGTKFLKSHICLRSQARNSIPITDSMIASV